MPLPQAAQDLAPPRPTSWPSSSRPAPSRRRAAAPRPTLPSAATRSVTASPRRRSGARSSRSASSPSKDAATSIVTWENAEYDVRAATFDKLQNAQHPRGRKAPNHGQTTRVEDDAGEPPADLDQSETVQVVVPRSRSIRRPCRSATRCTRSPTACSRRATASAAAEQLVVIHDETISPDPLLTRNWRASSISTSSSTSSMTRPANTSRCPPPMATPG